MKQTVKELFSPDDQYVYLMMLWAGRRETPQQVAARAWSTATALTAAVPPDDPRYQDITWAGVGEYYSNELVRLPHSLHDVEQLAMQNAERDENGEPDGLVPFHASLMAGGPNGTGIARYSVSAGMLITNTSNTVTIRFMPDYPLGSREEAADMFRRLVSAWQPDRATLSTFLTSRQIPDYARTSASYLTWLARPEFGTPPDFASADAEPFGDGTLLSIRGWSIDGVRKLHEEILAAGVSWKITNPMRPQEIPHIPGAPDVSDAPSR
ncbi:hypothetical protein QNO00_05135 [Arthrobacter sp. zg-Y1219]|uniref:hypothetical protein n=1 Tax=Arthrobacter sp. zg-Y1219 TaxID=3049067 RepID=UPI0024C3EBCA|nr:hypothetical protein [Arthrobacter sp. zg-Y1219]MDK1359649.1 hypothetical protein [Arthrobacter sp. zg-Y1219]